MDRALDTRFRLRRRLKQAGVGFLSVAAGGWLVFSGAEWLRPSVGRAEIRLARVERGDIEATVRAAGTVTPAFERVFSSPVEARVVRLLRRPGALLEPGDAILELDTSATRLELERLAERLARNGNDGTRRGLELDRTVAALQTRLEIQRLDLEIAEQRQLRNRGLAVEGLISEEALQESEVAVRKAGIQIRQVEEELLGARRSHDAEIERLALEAGILRAEIGDTSRQLELATTRTTESGVLTWVVEEAGATVARGDRLARIADLGSFRVEATVSDAYAPRIAIGQPVHVLIGESTLDGRLSAIDPTIENGALHFTVELEQASHPALRPNLRVDVAVVDGASAGVLRIPRGPYLQGGGDLHQVFVVQGDVAVRRQIRLGIVGYEHCELLAGLDEGDEVIVSDLRDRLHAERIRIR